MCAKGDVTLCSEFLPRKMTYFGLAKGRASAEMEGEGNEEELKHQSNETKENPLPLMPLSVPVRVRSPRREVGRQKSLRVAAATSSLSKKASMKAMWARYEHSSFRFL